MARKLSYGQFCPVAKACEILAERWTPLVLRELLCGSTRFSEIHKGVPLMSRSLLSSRLQELEHAGVIERRSSGGAHEEYHLTRAGEELRPVIEQLGAWGKQWTRRELSEDELDVGLLMWDIRRRINRQKIPERSVVVYFEFRDAPANRRRWWLLLKRDEVDVCLRDPGYEPDIRIATDVRTLTGIWMGDLSFGGALRARALEIEGPAALRRQFPAWLSLSMFADVERRLE